MNLLPDGLFDRVAALGKAITSVLPGGLGDTLGLEVRGPDTPAHRFHPAGTITRAVKGVENARGIGGVANAPDTLGPHNRASVEVALRIDAEGRPHLEQATTSSRDVSLDIDAGPMMVAP